MKALGKLVDELKFRPLGLRLFPDPLLRERSQPVNLFSTVLQDFANDMLAFMKQNNGIGLAAPQVGILQRIVVADIGGSPICMINPEIIKATGEDCMIEGCLSLPGSAIDITRRTRIAVQGKNISGGDEYLEIEGLLARVLQHEIDHLNGVLICDYEKDMTVCRDQNTFDTWKRRCSESLDRN